jgi:outer membrane protein
MKSSHAILFLLCFTAVSDSSQAQAGSAQQAPQNIVTVSFNEVVLQTAEAQKELNALQAKFAPRQSQLQALNGEIEALRKQLSSTADKLSETERSSLERSLDSKEKQFQRQADDLRNDSQTESQQAFQRVAQKVYSLLQTYSQQHGYSVVVERGSDAAPVVWYAAANVDITDELINVYNAQSANPAPSAPRNSSPGQQAKPSSSKPEGITPRP